MTVEVDEKVGLNATEIVTHGRKLKLRKREKLTPIVVTKTAIKSISDDSTAFPVVLEVVESNVDYNSS